MGRFRGKAPWTPEEDAKLVELFDHGLGRVGTVRYFPHRTRSAVLSRLRVLRPPEFPTVESLERNSKALADSINALILRMHPHDVAEMLGKPHLKIPGTERIMRGQFAERRLAA
jgi:hypothetical protein